MGQAAFFRLHLSTTGDFAILPNGQQKSSKSFSDLLLSLAAGGRRLFSFESSGQGGPTNWNFT